MGVLFPDMILELGIGRKAKVNSTSVEVHARYRAIRAKELREAMNSVFMLVKSNRAIESSVTRLRSGGIDMSTWVGRKLEVI